MKRILLLAAALILSAGLYAQSFHVQQMKDVNGMNIRSANAILETDDGNMMMSMTFDYCTRIMKMNDKGEIIPSKYIDINDGSHRGYYPFFRHPEKGNTNVYVYFTHGNPSVYNAIFLDNELNVIKRISTPLPYSDDTDRAHIDYIYTESCILDSENNIVVMKRLENTQNFIVLKLDLDGKILYEKEVCVDVSLENEWETLYYSFVVYNEQPLQYAYSFLRSSQLNSKMCLVVFDSDFDIIEINDKMNDQTLWRMERSSISRYDDEFYLTSTPHINSGYVTYSVDLKKIDKNHNVVNSYQYYTPLQYDIYNYEPHLSYKSIVPTKSGDIYWIYSKPRTNGMHDLYVSLLDGDLNLIWERMIQESVDLKKWFIMSATVRDNNDLIMSGWKWDEGCTNVLTVVMDSHTETTHVNEYAMEQRPYSFYPNPADNAISLSFSPDVNCEKVEIYSIDGKLCLSQNFNLNAVDINSLSSGIYMMKVSLSDGNVYTDKIVVR